MDPLEQATACIRRAQETWRDVPSARLGALPYIYDLSPARFGALDAKFRVWAAAFLASQGLEAKPSQIMKCPNGQLYVYRALSIIGKSVRLRRTHSICIGERRNATKPRAWEISAFANGV